MLVALNAVLPVFLLTALGFALGKFGTIDSKLAEGLNRLVYWIGLPSLLFHKIYNQQLQWNSVGVILAAFFLALLSTVGLAYILVWLGKMSDGSKAAFVQASYRGNLGFIGLPIVLYASSDAIRSHAETLAAVSMAPAAIGFNLIAVWLMVRHQPPGEPNGRKSSLLYPFVTNPLIVAGSIGVGFALMKWSIPQFLDRTLGGLSDMSVPVALLGLGASMAYFSTESLKSSKLLWGTGLAVFLKVAISPLLGFLFAIWFGLAPVEARIVMVFLATPTAIASFVLVGQFRGDQQLAATTIVLSTVFCVLSLPAALWVTQDSVWLMIQDWLS